MKKKIDRFIRKRDLFRIPIQLRTYGHETGKSDSEFGSLIGFFLSIIGVIIMLTITFYQSSRMLHRELDEEKTNTIVNTFEEFNQINFTNFQFFPLIEINKMT